MQQQNPSAITAELMRHALELEAIRARYIEARDALDEARRNEDSARDAYNKIGTIDALGRVVAHAGIIFDLFDQFATLGVEIQPVTSTEQKLELLAAQAGLASAFRSRVSIPELVLAGVDGKVDAPSDLHHLIAWGIDDSARLGAQRARESRDWQASELAAEERGATLLDPTKGWH